jgi:plastocyanin
VTTARIRTTRIHLTGRALAAALTLLVGLTACGGGDEVGDEALFEFDQDQAERLGGTSTTAGKDAAAQTTTTAVQQTTTTARQVATTLAPEKQAVSVEVKICDDDQGCANQYDPRIVDVPVGGKVRFVNAGSKPYAVESTSGAFQPSGPIAPGKAWVYSATQPGSFDYTGGAGRPYAVGTIRVIA